MPFQRIAPRAQLIAIEASRARLEVDGLNMPAQILHRVYFFAILDSTGSLVLQFNTMPIPQVVFDAGPLRFYEQTTWLVVVPIAHPYADRP
jgi:hypothetical protein